MFRRSIFWGLTLMLSTVLVWLVMQGRKEEAKQAAAPTEIVQTAESSPTRVVAPNDLEATEASGAGAATAGMPPALGPVAIRNQGKFSYHAVMLRISCLGSGGKVLVTRTHLAPETIPPGQTVTVGDVTLKDVPRGTTSYRIGILYCDLGPAPR
jgi:hypothetical protein